LRKKEARRILKFKPSVIKGNYSEIYALSDKNYSSAGVDADKMLSDIKVKKSAIELSRKYSCTVMASGKCDIVTDGKTLVRIENGVEMLGGVTGTGCMLGAICAAFLSVSKSIEAAVSACVVSGICGEISETDKGSGSFIINLLDNLKILSDDTISEKERIKIEKV